MANADGSFHSHRILSQHVQMMAEGKHGVDLESEMDGSRHISLCFFFVCSVIAIFRSQMARRQLITSSNPLKGDATIRACLAEVESGPPLRRDEITNFQTLRVGSASEALFSILEYTLAIRTPSVRSVKVRFNLPVLRKVHCFELKTSFFVMSLVANSKRACTESKHCRCFSIDRRMSLQSFNHDSNSCSRKVQDRHRKVVCMSGRAQYGDF
jgi:hypothetical protein